MKTIETLKQELIDHLAGIDKTKMTVYELSVYAGLLNKVAELYQPTYAEIMAGLAKSPFTLCAGEKREGA